ALCYQATDSFGRHAEECCRFSDGHQRRGRTRALGRTGAECCTDLCPVVRSVSAIRPRTPCGNFARTGRVLGFLSAWTGHAGITNSVKSEHRSQNCATYSGGFGISAAALICCGALRRYWQILLQKSLMTSSRSDSLVQMRFAAEAGDDGAAQSRPTAAVLFI